MKEYTQHEYGKFLPKMQEDEFNELCNDIQVKGLLFPIWLYRNQILDGWHRYQACKKVGVDAKFEEYEGESPLGFVVSSAKRRNLSASQRACLALDMLPALEKEGAENERIRKSKQCVGNQPLTTRQNLSSHFEDEDIGEDLDDIPKKYIQLNNSGSKGKAAVKAAAMLDSNPTYVAEVKKIKEEDPDAFDEIRDGLLTIQEYKKQKKQEKNVAYRRKESDLKSTTRIERDEDDLKLFNCDILDAKIADNSLDVIITDPPYPREFLSCWTKLAQFAAKKLKDGGILIAASGQSYLPQVYANMNIDGLNYYWTNCIYTPGVSAELQMKRLRTNWKPLLFYVKGEYKRTFQKTDVYVSEYEDTANGQQYHKWGQSYPVFNQLVLDYTYANDLVCDPFLGGGTTGLACIENKRKFIGIELVKETYDIAKERLSYE